MHACAPVPNGVVLDRHDSRRQQLELLLYLEAVAAAGHLDAPVKHGCIWLALQRPAPARHISIHHPAVNCLVHALPILGIRCCTAAVQKLLAGFTCPDNSCTSQEVQELLSDMVQVNSNLDIFRLHGLPVNPMQAMLCINTFKRMVIINACILLP